MQWGGLHKDFSMQCSLGNIMFNNFIVIFCIITTTRCVSEEEFFSEFASFHGIANVVIVQEQRSGGTICSVILIKAF